MIVVGYPGIGKSTLSKSSPEYIDLESSNFRHNGARPADWYIYYCQIAEDLSRQGYTVFVSCHEEVRDYLKSNSDELVVYIYPSIHLADEWTRKLRARYESLPSEKNWQALKYCELHYMESISDLMIFDNRPYVEINTMNYNLKELVVRAKKEVIKK